MSTVQLDWRIARAQLGNNRSPGGTGRSINELLAYLGDLGTRQVDAHLIDVQNERTE